MAAILFAQPFAVAADDSKKQGEFKRDKNPHEVEAWIHKTFLLGKIPGWDERLADYGHVGEGQGFDTIELFERDGEFVFVTAWTEEARGDLTILDAQILPEPPRDNKDEVQTKKGKAPLYIFSSNCKRASGELVVGAVRPEDGKDNCIYWSKKVQRAWKIEGKTGHITAISSDGVSCRLQPTNVIKDCAD